MTSGGGARRGRSIAALALVLAGVAAALAAVGLGAVIGWQLAVEAFDPPDIGVQELPSPEEIVVVSGFTLVGGIGALLGALLVGGVLAVPVLILAGVRRRSHDEHSREDDGGVAQILP